MSTQDSIFINRLKELAVTAQDARAALFGQASPRDPRVDEELNRRIQRFEDALSPAVILELLKRLESAEELADRAIKAVERANNEAVAIEQRVSKMMAEIKAVAGGSAL